MDCRHRTARRGMTLTEMVMAMALLTVFFAVLLPHFRILHRSWGLREASAESLQNGRVLFDHMRTQLATARAVTAVSGPDEPLGFVAFRDADDRPMRYEVGEDGWVRFGPAGSLSPLAGPVSRFTLRGYTAKDLETPTNDPAAVRLLRIEAAFPAVNGTGRERIWSLAICRRGEATP